MRFGTIFCDRNHIARIPLPRTVLKATGTEVARKGLLRCGKFAVISLENCCESLRENTRKCAWITCGAVRRALRRPGRDRPSTFYLCAAPLDWDAHVTERGWDRPGYDKRFERLFRMPRAQFEELAGRVEARRGVSPRLQTNPRAVSVRLAHWP